MPRRNIVVVFFAVIVSLVCYQRADRTPYAAVFGRVMHLITDRYVERVESRELFEGAMKGMVEQLDEHSAFIGPEALREFQADLDQEFGGVGIEVTIDRDTKRLMVMSPLLDTPAYKAGMRAGDIILRIDDLNTEGMSLRESVKIMRGKPGTIVQLTVLHRGDDEPEVLDIARAVIQTESVLGDLRDQSGRWQYYLEENPRIGYIRVTTFGEHTVDELRKALEFKDYPAGFRIVDRDGNQPPQVKQHEVDALIIDLRNNAGGLLTAAVDVCDMFISDGRIVSSRGRDGTNEKAFYAHAGKTIIDPEIPIAILVNTYSASASEIVAACLKDHGRARIVGTRTWGKGTVQNVIPIEGGKSVLKLTTASYWRPSNKNIHRRRGASEDDPWGVKPNPGFDVKLSKEQFEQVFLQRRQRDIIRIDENGQVKPPPPDGEPGGEPPGSSNDSSARDDATSGDEPSPDDEPIDDPQLRRAIEFIEGEWMQKRAAA